MRRHCFIGPAAVAAAALGLTGLAAPGAHAAENALDLHEESRTTFVLAPGETALWPLGVRTRAPDISALRMTLESDGPVATLAPEFAQALTLEVQACSEPWQDAVCPTGARTLMKPGPLGHSGTRTANLATDDGRIPAEIHLLTGVTLAEDAPNSVQGSSTILRLGVHAHGPDSGSGGSPDPGAGDPPGGGNPIPNDNHGALPNTGLDIALYGLLGLAAVLAGMALSRWKKTDTRRQGPPG
jgi:hypothetical protein